jgi:cytoskeletal protein RodZ
MKLSTSLGALGLAAMVALAGCSSGGESDTASTPDAASPPAATAQSTPATDAAGSATVDDSACQVAEISGESNNPELQALATQVYSSLDCAAAESLADQLKAAAADPGLTQQAEDSGWALTVGEAAGGVSMSLVEVEARTTCMISVLDSPKAKTLSCGNV